MENSSDRPVKTEGRNLNERELQQEPENCGNHSNPVQAPLDPIEAAATVEERRSAILVAVGNSANSVWSRFAEARARRFKTFYEGRDWALRNADNLWALELWWSRSDEFFVHYVTRDSKQRMR